MDSEGAYQKILRLATVREYASEQIRERLRRDGYESAHIEEALDRAIRNRVIDDARFAEFYVRSKIASGRGRLGIERELDGLGIPADEVPVLRELDADGEDDELDRALSVLRMRPPRSKNVREAAFRRLLQRGFSVGIASAAARQWAELQLLDEC